jgi:hypothetical protein
MAGTIQQLAEEVRSHRSWQPADPDDLHDGIKGMGDVTGAVGEVLNAWGDAIDETNADPQIGDALREASAAINTIMEELDAKLSGGIMQRRG